VAPVSAVRRGASGRDLIKVLGATGRLQLAFGLAASIGLVVGS
jgi:1,4-dihydroxy-2-naphthoate octaprenyltransferase